MPKQVRKAKAEVSGPRPSWLFRDSALARASAFGLRFSLLPLLLAAGCVSQDKSREEVRKAYEAGLQQGRREAEMRLTQVLIRGPVQRPAVPWRVGLTLAQAIVEAVYTSPQDPSAIGITRGNRIIPVDLAELLRGIDIPLELGDIIDIR